jgi:hypothetical protein
MSWTSSQVTQNGNSTVSWSISGGSLSTHDAIVVQPTAGSSGVKINSITAKRDPARYSVSVSVVGAEAMAYRFAAEQMD